MQKDESKVGNLLNLFLLTKNLAGDLLSYLKNNNIEPIDPCFKINLKSLDQFDFKLPYVWIDW